LLGDIAVVLLKAVPLFFLLLYLTRLLGKKLISQLTFFDFVAGITLGSVTANTLTGRVPLVIGIVSLIAWSGLTLLIDLLVLKSLPARKIIDGEPTIVIQNGKILDWNMRRNRYNLDDLMTQLRSKNIFDPAQVEFAILEPDGKLSVLPKAQYQPLTPADLKMSMAYQGLATVLVKDGVVMERNLRRNNLTEDWLMTELKRRGIENVSDVFYATLDTSGNLFIDLKHDGLNHVQKVED